MIFLISGSSRKVGKTTLAFKLLSVLPGSVYAKLGHGVRKRHKPDCFFHSERDLMHFIRTELPLQKHIVVESNRALPKHLNAIRIFVDGDPFLIPSRKDRKELMAMANIRLSKESTLRYGLLLPYYALSSFDLAKKISVILFEHKYNAERGSALSISCGGANEKQ